ncbi:hypothetical protein K503DRAFT_766910 [Rhizopogon vinicolor AM-OR11-026]|uniref:Uncharacterized protein n=1 Tax=Rhizopogon vinicolor AM-OR11-026 TaxID=1314800 RepID=A0A1B7NBT0_9AGAM|nr:hypothetical protein K503DRAFT_766910 [Rhizopogon vinicolor AM-OR11-026]
MPYKLSSFTAYTARRFASCASYHFARTPPNPVRVPTISFLRATAYESSSRPKKWKSTRLKGLSVSVRVWFLNMRALARCS